MAYIPRMTPLYPPTRPLPISQVLDSSFRMFKVSFVRCLAFGPLWIIVGQLPNIYHLAMGRPRVQFGGNDPIWWLLYIVGTLGSITISSALILHQRDIVSHVPTRMLPQLLAASRRLPALIGIGVLSVLIIGVPSGVVLFPIARDVIAAPGIGTLSLVLLVLLYVSYVSLLVSVGWTALLIDRMSPIAALRHSVKLVLGNWWRTFAVFLVALVVVLVIYFVAAAVFIPLVGAMDVALVAVVSEMLIFVMSALVTPYFGATMLALYGDLKARKEGSDLEQRISAAARP
jgi:hypothetical protein